MRDSLSGNGDPYSWVWQLPIRGDEIISVASGSADKIKLLIHGGKVLTDSSQQQFPLTAFEYCTTYEYFILNEKG